MINSKHSKPLSDVQLRVKALESILLEKGVVDQNTLDTIVDIYENRVGPHLGAKVVARAWTNPEFKNRLLSNGAATIAELGMGSILDVQLVVKENTPTVHNMIVCTLCSCYPWSVLGLPPNWYKSFPYRSRAVSDPRGVLMDFGLALPTDTEVCVWDSTANMRYMVLPLRPEGSENLSEDELAALVTRNAMIGTAVVSVS
ncbi:MAG: nitrile hydratase subunit alpha [Gammaproteobacteria bacterium]|nr:nitrile hydratase subunit alpha [Gammaproteobacteria bacterium]